MKTVGDLSDGVAGLLTGTNLDNVTNLYGAYERAARTMAQQIDAPEASYKLALNLYDGVFDYGIGNYIFGGAINDLRPQGVTRTPLDSAYKLPIALFDQTKAFLPSGYNVTFEWNKGVPVMRVAQTKAQAKTNIDAMTSDTGWTAAGSASALREDATVYYQSPSSLRFTLTGSSTGTLTKTLTNPLNIEAYEDVGVAFLAIRIPDGATVSSLTSIALRFGSSATDYDEVSTTTGFVGAWVAGEWLLVAFDFSGAISTGTPDWEAMDYVQVRIAHTAGFTNFRVGGLFMSLPSPHELLYQTTAIFLRSGTVSKDITEDTDEIVLNDAAYNIFEHECALAVILQNGGSMSSGIGKEYNDKLYRKEIGLYDRYRADNPSEELRTVGQWY